MGAVDDGWVPWEETPLTDDERVVIAAVRRDVPAYDADQVASMLGLTRAGASA